MPELDRLLDRFRGYAARFMAPDDLRVRRDVQLKYDHTLRVISETRELVAAEQLPEDVARLAGLAALFHDWSRFEQLRQFATFNDGLSFDHGAASARLVQEQHLLDDLAPEERGDVLAAVAGHNQLAVPSGLTPRGELLCRILRDADKIDIFGILLDYLKHPDDPTVVLNMGAASALSPAVIRHLEARRVPPHRELGSGTDFLASRLLWADELNFAFSARRFLERDYCARLTAFLPPLPLLERVCRDSEANLRRRAGANGADA